MLNGGQSATANLTSTLGRRQQHLSQVRDTLMSKGDVYVPRRGEPTLTVAVFAPYLLANYEAGRERASRPALLPLEEMRRNAEAIASGRAMPPSSPHRLQRCITAQVPSSPIGRPGERSRPAHSGPRRRLGPKP